MWFESRWRWLFLVFAAFYPSELSCNIITRNDSSFVQGWNSPFAISRSALHGAPLGSDGHYFFFLFAVRGLPSITQKLSRVKSTYLFGASLLFPAESLTKSRAICSGFRSHVHGYASEVASRNERALFRISCACPKQARLGDERSFVA